MRIAVLDNDRSQADLISQVLTGAGHACQSFNSGRDLLGVLRKDSFDMLILDWQVADLSGVEVLRHAKEKLPAHTPMMFVTSNAGEDDIVAGIGAGADDYMIAAAPRRTATRVQALRRAYPSQKRRAVQFGPMCSKPGRGG
jgi:DNA-binding response OmpR family regulator